MFFLPGGFGCLVAHLVNFRPLEACQTAQLPKLLPFFLADLAVGGDTGVGTQDLSVQGPLAALLQNRILPVMFQGILDRLDGVITAQGVTTASLVVTQLVADRLLGAACQGYALAFQGSAELGHAAAAGGCLIDDTP